MRDQPVSEKQLRMERSFTSCKTKEALGLMATLYLMDESYPRNEIAAALNKVEKEKGW